MVEERGDQLCSWAASTGGKYSSFEAESMAGKEAARILARREDTGGVALVTDSESLVRAQEGESKEGRLGELRSVLWALRHESWVIKLLWFPVHYVLGGKERAVEEAKMEDYGAGGSAVEQEDEIEGYGEEEDGVNCRERRV